ncbi:MAG: hypothetical protein Kow0069_34530 [Promethearchaeota archaeon]
MGRTSERLASVDLLRGASITYMFVGHLLDWWLAAPSRWVWALTYATFDCLGAGAFVFVSGVSLQISWRRGRGRGGYWVRFSTRTGLIGALGLTYNLLGFFRYWGWAAAWSWFVLQTIAVSRLLAAPLLRTSKTTRIVVTLATFALATPLRNALLLAKDSSFLGAVAWHALFNPPHENTIFPFFGSFLAGTVTADVLLDAREVRGKEGRESGTITPVRGAFAAAGLLVVVGLILGAPLVDWDYGYQLLDLLNRHPNWELPGIPLFLVRNSTAWTFFCTGVQVTVMTVLFTARDLDRVNRPPGRGLGLFGRYSLTLYVLHHVGYYWFTFSLDHRTVWLPLLACTLAFWLLTRVWDAKFGGKGSLEWAFNEVTRNLERRLISWRTRREAGEA